MVDGIRSMGSMAATPATPVTAAKAPAADVPRAPIPAPSTPSTGSLAKALAASPPVDKERVAQIKRAIATGTFPILPATIADRLIALKYEWSGREPQ